MARGRKPANYVPSDASASEAKPKRIRKTNDVPKQPIKRLSGHQRRVLKGKPDTKAGFTCPFCGHGTTGVTNSRGYLTFEGIMRRRECAKCEERFTTLEHIPQKADVVILKRNGSREPFNRDKLMRSISHAMTKGRPIAAERLERICNAIVRQIDGRDIRQYTTVTSNRLGTLVMASLKELDEVSYIRFASSFMHFTNRSDFVRLIDMLEDEEITKSQSSSQV